MRDLHELISKMQQQDILIVGTVEDMKQAQDIARKIGLAFARIWVAPDPYKLRGMHSDVHVFVDRNYKASDKLKEFIHMQNTRVPR